MIALTGGQELIFAVVILIMTVVFIVEFWVRNLREPPLPHSTRRLRKELERHQLEDEDWEM